MHQKPNNEGRSAGAGVALVGTIERFTFRNPDTGWAVVRFRPDGGHGPITAVGQLAQLVEGQKVKISGKESDHPRYGRQVEVEIAEAVLPATADGIRTYLASSLVKGIGPATAERIVERFGAETLRVIEEQPDRLREVKGLGARRIADLVAGVAAQRDVQEVMVFLRTHGLGQGLAARIVKRYGKGASALIQANPYRLADEVIGIGFRTADRLAMHLGIGGEAPERLRAAMVHVLGQGARDGHCYLPEDELMARTAELLQCAEELLRPEIPELAAAGHVVREVPVTASDSAPPAVVYPRALHQAETGAARALRALLRQPGPPLPIRADDAVNWLQAQGDMELPDEQRTALVRAMSEPVSVITGGPGVGKTTIVRALAEVLARKELRLLLAAPTGRAAKRLEESTGRAACTLHRLLEYQPGIHRFGRDANNPLEGDLLVVDEASMLDVQLAYYLLRAIPRSMKLVLVGDVHQLPSVAAGNVLDDVIESGSVPVTALSRIFRQKQDSLIVRSAHGILRGQMPEGGGEGSDFFFVQARNGAHARELIRELVTRRIPRAFELDPLHDVQVLCPMYRGDAGADRVNTDLQDALNPSGPEVERGGKRYRQGDKVMQIRNDYDTDVFNGDTGRIAHVQPAAATMIIQFGSRELTYRAEDLDQIVPAYAISVHRSQGSEYPAVVMPLTTEHFLMLRRSLLYTAITRGKRLVVLVGSRKGLELAVRNAEEAARHSGLSARLRGRPGATTGSPPQPPGHAADGG